MNSTIVIMMENQEQNFFKVINTGTG